MEGPKNYEDIGESNAFNNYLSQTNSNYDTDQQKNITNKAKEMIKSFKNQYFINNDNTQRELTTEVNQIPKNYPSFQKLPIQNKAKEDLNSYDYYFSSSRGGNRDNVSQ